MTEFAKAYGGALYALAQEEKLEDEMLSQLEGVCALLSENPDYVRLLESRNVPKAERVSLLDAAFGGRVGDYLLSFMKILCERGAFGQMSECRKAYVGEYDQAHGILPATAITARPLDEDQKKRLVAALEQKTGKTIRLTQRVDETLVGGMRVQMQGMTLDNTVASRMDRLRRALLSQS